MTNHNSIDQRTRRSFAIRNAPAEKQLVESILFLVVILVPVPLVCWLYKTYPW